MIHWFLKTQHFIPKGHYKTIHDIDYNALYQEGKRLLLIDLDNTLIPYDEHVPSQDLRQYFSTLKAIGFEIVIISNNRLSRVKRFASVLELPYKASAKKPLKCGFKKALRLTEQVYPKDEVCVIGDQLMTDIYGANRVGYEAILVLPIKKASEKWYTKINRLVENKVLRKMKRKYPKTFEKHDLESRIL